MSKKDLLGKGHWEANRGFLSTFGSEPEWHVSGGDSDERLAICVKLFRSLRQAHQEEQVTSFVWVEWSKVGRKIHQVVIHTVSIDDVRRKFRAEEMEAKVKAVSS